MATALTAGMDITACANARQVSSPMPCENQARDDASRDDFKDTAERVALFSLLIDQLDHARLCLLSSAQRSGASSGIAAIASHESSSGDCRESRRVG